MNKLLTFIKQVLFFPFRFISGRGKAITNFDDITNGAGAIIDHNGKKVAVYKDDEGKVHAVSAVCTHLGCIIGWNNVEKTWDCPCHGSRYTFDGVVIHGPTVKNLEKIDI